MASESRTRKAGRDFLGIQRPKPPLSRTDGRQKSRSAAATDQISQMDATRSRPRPGGQPANRAPPDRVPSICLKRSSIRDVHKFSGFFYPHYYLPQYLHKPPLPLLSRHHLWKPPRRESSNELWRRCQNAAISSICRFRTRKEKLCRKVSRTAKITRQLGTATRKKDV